jgi:hypothetical protein
MPEIIPTIGRVVWYWPSPADDLPRIGDQPLAAHIAGIWSNTCVNLMVIDANGNTHSRTSVLLYQGEGERPAHCFCEWMPYQRGQAARTEKAEALTEERISAIIQEKLAAHYGPPPTDPVASAGS